MVSVEDMYRHASLLPKPDNNGYDGYTENLWASEWHTLFPASDERSKLTWRDRFDLALGEKGRGQAVVC